MQVETGLVPIPFYGERSSLNYQERSLLFWHETILGKRTALPPAGWTENDFDDGYWVRATAYRACRTPYLERLFLRGRFEVTEPAKVKNLRLELGYHGGAIVFLNGREIGRKNLVQTADGELLGEPYPLDAYVDAAGTLIALRGDPALWRQPPSADVAARIAGRVRTLSVLIPSGALRRGVNLVAVEIVRAPYHRVVSEQIAMSKNHGDHKTFELSWNTCEIKSVKLTADSADGLVPSVVRPAGVQAWNSDLLATDVDVDWANPCEPLRPIVISGAAGGVYSGKLGIGSPSPIRGLTASLTPLRGSAGTIPLSAVRIRYAMPWSDVVMTGADCNELLPYPAEPSPLYALYESAPAEIPVSAKQSSQRCVKLPNQIEPVPGAVTAVWVTVRIPQDAQPGLYAGSLRVSAEHWQGVEVPVQVKVLDWKVPDPSLRRTWVELIQSPDTLAIEYDVPLWSEKHWQMIEKSMAFLAEMGSRVLYVPLIAQTNAGNAQSMVRWVKKADGTYDYDFSVMERYLDTAERYIGKPDVVVFTVWERYLTRKDSSGRGFWIESSLKIAVPGPMVTVVDEAGKTENVVLPDYTEPASRDLWKPLFDRLRERMAKRGIEKAMHLGMVSDFWASKEQVAFLKEVSGNLPWASAGHYFRDTLYDGLASFGYSSSYFGPKFGYTESLSGWKNPKPFALFERVGLDAYPVTKWRLIGLQSITGDVRGVGRIALDAWPVKDKSGRRVARVYERFPAANWGYLNPNCAVLAPSPDGPVATQKFEALREGVEECEAVVSIEQALADKAAVEKMGPELAKKCQQAIDEHLNAMWRAFAIYHSGPNYSHEATSWRERVSAAGYVWFLNSNWQERAEKLYTLAGEAQRALSR